MERVTIQLKSARPSSRRAISRRFLTAVVSITLAGLCLFTSCGTVLPERGTSRSAPDSTPARQHVDTEVPEVTNPLDIKTLTSDPCTALSRTDLGELGLDPEGRQDSRRSGEECSWNYRDITIGALTVMVYGANKDGLAGIYRQRDTAAKFEPTQVAGYPGVYADAVQENPAADGRCQLYIGVSDRDVLVMITQLDGGPDADDPCRIADHLGEMTLSHLT